MVSTWLSGNFHARLLYFHCPCPSPATRGHFSQPLESLERSRQQSVFTITPNLQWHVPWPLSLHFPLLHAARQPVSFSGSAETLPGSNARLPFWQSTPNCSRNFWNPISLFGGESPTSPRKSSYGRTQRFLNSFQIFIFFYIGWR